MCSYRIAVLLLICVFLKHNPSLAQRPGFVRDIMGSGNGNDGLFNDIKAEIIKKSATRLDGYSLHLAHVFPWAAIDKCIGRYISGPYANQTVVTEIVEITFEIDTQAVVPKSWKRRKQRRKEIQTRKETKKTRKQVKKESMNTREEINSETGDFIPDSNEIVLHAMYVGANLVRVNEYLLGEALKKCQIQTGGLNEYECKEFLNSAPANLRYGLGRHNIAISNRLDLMGDASGKITTKEKRLIAIMEDCYTTIEEWCGRRNPYCVSNKQGKFGIRSSSSYHTFVY